MNRSVVAYQGEPGAFSELAAERLVGTNRSLLPCARIEDVFAALKAGAAACAVVPYVNSLAGPVQPCCNLLATQPVRVLDETVLEVSHALIALPGVVLNTLRNVLSHPVALKQCRSFLRRHPHLRVVATEDTAGAVAHIAARDRRDCAAIASERTAELYDAVILERNVQDSADNRTSFLLIAWQD